MNIWPLGIVWRGKRKPTNEDIVAAAMVLFDNHATQPDIMLVVEALIRQRDE